VADWSEEDFLNIAASDEFFVYAIRRPNYQNDRIWAKSIEDIEADERYQEIVRYPTCIGIFVMFTARKMLWVLKEQGESWNGQYFRETILKENVIPFLRNPENVIDNEKVIFLHDKASCMKANATQHLLEDEGVNFWGNDIWSGNSPDLNPAEHIGAIIKDKVEDLMAREDRGVRLHKDVLKRNLENVLKSLENDSDLFVDLLFNMKKCFDACRVAQGGHFEI
jgi:hypothetical protein